MATGACVLTSGRHWSKVDNAAQVTWMEKIIQGLGASPTCECVDKLLEESTVALFITHPDSTSR